MLEICSRHYYRLCVFVPKGLSEKRSGQTRHGRPSEDLSQLSPSYTKGKYQIIKELKRDPDPRRLVLMMTLNSLSRSRHAAPSSFNWHFLISDWKLSLSSKNFWLSSWISILKLVSLKYFLNIFVKFCSVRSDGLFKGSIWKLEPILMFCSILRIASDYMWYALQYPRPCTLSTFNEWLCKASCVWVTRVSCRSIEDCGSFLSVDFCISKSMKFMQSYWLLGLLCTTFNLSLCINSILENIAHYVLIHISSNEI